MKRAAGIAASACGALLLAACSGSGGPRGYTGPPLRPIAEPSMVVAAEMSFARAARENGQWTAFADFAAPDAMMFVPGPVRARDWLDGRADPPQAMNWQPHHIWSSCDGSLAVDKGAWQKPDGTQGYFTTIWQRQQDGSYKWLLEQDGLRAEPLEAPDMVGTDIADCPKRATEAPRGPTVAPFIANIASDGLSGVSNDGSLRWRMEADADGSRVLHVSLARGGSMEEAPIGGAPAR